MHEQPRGLRIRRATPPPPVPTPTHQSVLMWNRLWYSNRVTKMVGSVMVSEQVRPPRDVATKDRYLQRRK